MQNETINNESESTSNNVKTLRMLQNVAMHVFLLFIVSLSQYQHFSSTVHRSFRLLLGVEDTG